jgi:thiol-disulfide isomerase/thioredoxin
MGAAATAVVVAIIVSVALAVGGGVDAVSNPTAVPASVLAAVTQPSASLLSSVGEGGQPGQLSRLSGSQPLKDSSGRPEVVYVGAEYCPYCAAERWSMIMALSRFGTFSGLKEMSSSSSDTDPDTSTFTFVDATYSSPWVDFSSTEVEDRDENPLQSPSASVEALFTVFDQQPYSASPAGEPGYPFLDIAGRFVLYQTSYDPAILQGLSWKQIAADIGDAQSPVAQAIVGNANYLTAAICVATGNQPAAVCSTATIQTMEAALEAQPVVGG